MIRQILKIDPRRTGPMDLALMGACTLLAIYSLCQSVASNPNAWFFMGINLLGILVSFLVSRYAPNAKIVRYDALLYAVAATAGFAGQSWLNTLSPDFSFKGQLSAAGGICWMVVLGSFFTWRDKTLLFQAMPSLAIFGLVGCFDIYREATVLFFGFMLGVAALMARAHGRMMMNQAESSGHRGVGNLTDGPWRWMAGPEWALASATAVIVISVVGAPLIQQEVHDLGLSGNYHIPVPAAANVLPALFNPNPTGSITIGTGPANLSKTPVLKVKCPDAAYLRATSYYQYAGSGWRTDLGGVPRGKSVWDVAQKELRNADKVEFSVEMLRTMAFLPIPGNAISLSEYRYVDRTWDGAYAVGQTFKNLPRIEGLSMMAKPQGRPVNVPKNLDPRIEAMKDTSRVPSQVIELARKSAAGGKNDFEKAELIKSEIEKLCKYNLRAKPIPAGEDVVKYFLFESHEGYCDLFASSMVVMARSVGIPARYSTGYLAQGEQNNGYYTLTDADAHAWAELYFKDFGWVTFDATEGAASVEGAKRGDSTDPPFYQTPGFYGLLSATSIGGGWGLIILVRRLRNPKAKLPRKELAKVYARFERTIQPMAGHPRRLSQTAAEYLRLGKHSLGPLYPMAAGLQREFEEALYGMEEPSPAIIAQLSLDVKTFAAEAKNGKTLVEAGKGKRR